MIFNVLRRLGLLRSRHRRYWLITIFLLFLLFIGSLLMVYFEKDTNEQFQGGFGEGLWWSLVTITTVGYGDKFPITTGGRITAFIVMLGGIGAFGYLAGSLLDDLLQKERGKRSVKWKNHFVICDYSYKALSIIEELENEIHDVQIALVAPVEDNPAADFPHVHFIKGESTEEANLLKANVPQARAVFILAEAGVQENVADSRSALTTLAVRHLNPDCWITTEVLHPRNIEHFHRAGANEIISSGELSSHLMVRASLYHGSTKMMHELLTNSYGQELYQSKITPKYDGKTFNQLFQDFYQDRCLVMGLNRGGKVLTNPEPDTILKENDLVVYVAKKARN